MSGDKCSGHCSFDAGFCGFTNAEKADFDWMVSRGSSNPNTGPIRDHSSDKAHLISEEFPPTFKNDPHCLRFWTHMYGSGVGELNVYIIVNDKWSKVWSLSGDAGNNWYMGQTPISAKTPFKIAFEGIVGRNELGNIALDDVTISPGVCPTFPQVAGAQVGDCTFEDDTCNWKNPEIGESVYDELDWERLDASTGPTSRYPTYDHTTGSRGGYFISLSRKGVQKAGDRAHFVSNEMKAGPNLGKLSVLIKSFDKNDNTVITPIWRLHNGKRSFMGVWSSVWGNNRVSGFIALDDLTFYKGDCDSLPKRASLIKAECTFDRDACGWRNTSTGDFEWRLATLARRPANLPDKSFGAPVGYAYFDIFNTGSKANSVRMSSPTILKKEITTDESFKKLQKVTTTRKKNDEESNDESDPIWSISAADLNTARPEPQNGGFAIDHLIFNPGPCSIQRVENQVTSQTSTTKTSTSSTTSRTTSINTQFILEENKYNNTTTSSSQIESLTQSVNQLDFLTNNIESSSTSSTPRPFSLPNTTTTSKPVTKSTENPNQKDKKKNVLQAGLFGGNDSGGSWIFPVIPTTVLFVSLVISF
ncbi:unnamed protein product [Lepeophtheirus salmonis]|uniref:(salmon louse) hypothetical protein n=1 Tax=Lepeophtheirus salmonis TaxID=72036 RepID=A0A7R8H844_LEPSM|nr:unnamed protein product [Lepeophtheirus salmonis]CAF2923057.1 unnamed protein product [Lepeophtheirus salmonis]